MRVNPCTKVVMGAVAIDILGAVHYELEPFGRPSAHPNMVHTETSVE